MTKLRSQQAGFTLVEVLIAAVIFMVGFSILIGLLNSSLNKFSIKEMQLANNLARSTMTSTLAMADTAFLDSVVERSNISFRVRRSVEIGDGLASVLVTVSREKNNKKIIELYNAFLIAHE